MPEVGEKKEEKVFPPPPPPHPEVASPSCDNQDAVRSCTSEDGHSKFCSRPLYGISSRRKIRRNPGVLILWVYRHEDHPYPSKGEKEELAKWAGMTTRQLNDWFANARRNIKKKGWHDWKKKHSPSSAELNPRPESKSFSHGVHSDFASYQHTNMTLGMAPGGGPVGLSPHLPHTTTPTFQPPPFSYFTPGNNKAPPMGLSPATPNSFSTITSAGESPTTATMLQNAAPSYYSPYFNCKPLPYATGSASATDSAHNIPVPAGQPVLMDGFMHHFNSSSPRAFKLFHTRGLMMSQHLTTTTTGPPPLGPPAAPPYYHHHYAYKIPPASPAQLSTGSSPYSDMSSPIFGGHEKIDESESLQQQAASIVTPQYQMLNVKEEMHWTGGEQQEGGMGGSRVFYAYQPTMSSGVLSTAATADTEITRLWGSSSVIAGGSGSDDGSGEWMVPRLGLLTTPGATAGAGGGEGVEGQGSGEQREDEVAKESHFVNREAATVMAPEVA